MFRNFSAVKRTLFCNRDWHEFISSCIKRTIFAHCDGREIVAICVTKLSVKQNCQSFTNKSADLRFCIADSRISDSKFKMKFPLTNQTQFNKTSSHSQILPQHKTSNLFSHPSAYEDHRSLSDQSLVRNRIIISEEVCGSPNTYSRFSH